MNPLRSHPLRTLGALLGAAFVLFLLSGIPRYRDARSGVDLAIGDVFWFGFLLCGLLFVIGGVYAVVRAAHERRTA